MIACFFDNVRTIEALIKRGANVCAVDNVSRKSKNIQPSSFFDDDNVLGLQIQKICLN
jgi:Ankyrin repeat